MKTNGIVVINLHGVLIDEQWEIYKYMQTHWSEYCRDMKPLKLITHDEFIERPQYDVCNSYMKADYPDKQHYVFGIYKIQNQIVRDILESDTFYSRADLLNFAIKCILKPNFIDSKKVKKVIILIDEYTKKQVDNAVEFCRSVFDHPKINLLTVKPDKKAELLTKELRSFSLYMDHSISNIRRISEKIPDLTMAEFIIPRYRFNKMPLEVSMLIHGKNGAFTYYSEKSDDVIKNIL